MHFTRNNNVNTLFSNPSNPQSRDLVSHNPGISGLKNGPGSWDSGSRDCNPYLYFQRFRKYQCKLPQYFYCLPPSYYDICLSLKRVYCEKMVKGSTFRVTVSLFFFVQRNLRKRRTWKVSELKLHFRFSLNVFVIAVPR